MANDEIGEEEPTVQYYWPNKMGRMMLLSLEDVMGMLHELLDTMGSAPATIVSVGASVLLGCALHARAGARAAGHVANELCLSPYMLVLLNQ